MDDGYLSRVASTLESWGGAREFDVMAAAVRAGVNEIERLRATLVPFARAAERSSRDGNGAMVEVSLHDCRVARETLVVNQTGSGNDIYGDRAAATGAVRECGT